MNKLLLRYLTACARVVGRLVDRQRFTRPVLYGVHGSETRQGPSVESSINVSLLGLGSCSDVMYVELHSTLY